MTYSTHNLVVFISVSLVELKENPPIVHMTPDSTLDSTPQYIGQYSTQ